MEESAKTIVEEFTGGTAKRRDPNGGPVQLHDYDVTLPDGQAIALEVTSAADASIRKFWDAVGEHN